MMSLAYCSSFTARRRTSIRTTRQTPKPQRICIRSEIGYSPNLDTEFRFAMNAKHNRKRRRARSGLWRARGIAGFGKRLFQILQNRLFAHAHFDLCLLAGEFQECGGVQPDVPDPPAASRWNARHVAARIVIGFAFFLERAGKTTAHQAHTRAAKPMITGRWLDRRVLPRIGVGKVFGLDPRFDENRFQPAR